MINIIFIIGLVVLIIFVKKIINYLQSIGELNQEFMICLSFLVIFLIEFLDLLCYEKLLKFLGETVYSRIVGLYFIFWSIVIWLPEYKRKRQTLNFREKIVYWCEHLNILIFLFAWMVFKSISLFK